MLLQCLSIWNCVTQIGFCQSNWYQSQKSATLQTSFGSLTNYKVNKVSWLVRSIAQNRRETFSILYRLIWNSNRQQERQTRAYKRSISIRVRSEGAFLYNGGLIIPNGSEVGATIKSPSERETIKANWILQITQTKRPLSFTCTNFLSFCQNNASR